MIGIEKLPPLDQDQLGQGALSPDTDPLGPAPTSHDDLLNPQRPDLGPAEPSSEPTPPDNPEPQKILDPTAKARAEKQARTEEDRQKREITSAVTRQKDRELLNGSARVKMKIFDAGNHGVKLWQGALAKVRNGFAHPNRMIKSWAHSRARHSYDRKAARLEAAQAAGNTHLAEKILQPKVKAAEEKMKQREAELYERTQAIDQRRDNVKQKAHDRREGYMATIRSKHEERAGRRALKSELRANGYTWSEARQTMGELPAEARREIGRLAVVAFASERHANSAQGAENSASDKIVRNNLRKERASASAREHQQQAEQARQSATTTRKELIPKTEEKVATLRAEFAALKPEDTDYLSKHKELTDAVKQLSRYHDQARRQEKASASHNNKSIRKARQSRNLQGRAGDLRGDLATAQQRVGARREVQASDRVNLKETINNVINAKPAETSQTTEKSSTESEPVEKRTKAQSDYAKLHGERAYELKYKLAPAANAEFSRLSQALRATSPSNATEYRDLYDQTAAAREAAVRLQQELDEAEEKTGQLM